jgi:hypothetical protein
MVAAWSIGPHFNALKTHCPSGHPYEGDNVRWNKKGRICVTCDREWKRNRSPKYRATMAGQS